MLFALYICFHLSLCVWVIFMGGARVIEGSWLAAFEFHPMAGEREIKLLAWLYLLTLPIILLLR